MSDITLLLEAASLGDGGAHFALFESAYQDLRNLAHAKLRSSGRSSLQTTVLVHESFLRLTRAASLTAADRLAFFAYAAKVMRSVIIDAARAQLLSHEFPRAHGETAITGTFEPAPAGGAAEIVRVHDALLALDHAEPRLARVVEMRYFGGYSEDEIAAALGVTKRTVSRDWEKARLLLLEFLRR